MPTGILTQEGHVFIECYERTGKPIGRVWVNQLKEHYIIKHNEHGDVKYPALFMFKLC